MSHQSSHNVLPQRRSDRFEEFDFGEICLEFKEKMPRFHEKSNAIDHLTAFVSYINANKIKLNAAVFLFAHSVIPYDSDFWLKLEELYRDIFDSYKEVKCVNWDHYWARITATFLKYFSNPAETTINATSSTAT